MKACLPVFIIFWGMLRGNTIVINEINYHSADDFNTEDWVEFYNESQETVNMSGWVFKDKADYHNFTFPENTDIVGRGYLVLCRSTALFTALHPQVSNFIGDFDFGLSGAGELIRLFDAEQNLVDSVHYNDAGEWPTEPDGSGATLVLINPLTDNAAAANWTASSGYGTPGVENLNYLLHHEPNGPERRTLFSLHPNPFNSSININFTVVHNGMLDITLFDINGRQIKQLLHEYKLNGDYSVRWQGDNQAGNMVETGVYFCKIQSGSWSESWKVILLK